MNGEWTTGVEDGNSYDASEYTCVCAEEETGASVLGEELCPSSWTFLNGRCWKAVVPDSEVDFLEAQEVCATEGALLASIRDISEYDITEQLQRRMGARSLWNMWIGLKRCDSCEEEWEWVDGSPFLIDLFGDGAPDDNGDCGRLASFEPASWFDSPCDLKLPVALCIKAQACSAVKSCPTPPPPQAGAIFDCSDQSEFYENDSCTYSAADGYSCNNEGSKYQCIDGLWTIVDDSNVELENAECWLDCTVPPTLPTGTTSTYTPGEELAHGETCQIALGDDMYTCENLGNYVCSNGIWKLEDTEIMVDDVACLKKCEVPELIKGLQSSCEGVVPSGNSCDLMADNETVSCTGPSSITCTSGVWLHEGDTAYNPESDSDCKIDCVKSVWSPWSSCSKICGTGTQTASRTIEVYPALGGRECGELTKSQDCNTHECKCSADIIAGIDLTYNNNGQTQVQFGLARAQLFSLIDHLGDAVHPDRAHMGLDLIGATSSNTLIALGSPESESTNTVSDLTYVALLNSEGIVDTKTAFLEFLRDAVAALKSSGEEGRQPFLVVLSDGLPQYTNMRKKNAKQFIKDVQAIVRGKDAPSDLKVACYRTTARSAFHAFFQNGICDVLWDFSEGTDENGVTSKTRDVIGFEMANYLCPNLETHEQGEDEDEVVPTGVDNPCDGIQSPRECNGVRRNSDGTEPEGGKLQRGVKFCQFQFDDYRKCVPEDKYMFLFNEAETAAIQSTDSGIQKAGDLDPCFAQKNQKKCKSMKVELPTSSRRMLKRKKNKVPKFKVCSWDGELCNLKPEFVANYLECSTLNQATCGSYQTFCEWDSDNTECKPITITE